MTLQERLKEDPIVILDGGRRTPRADILVDNKKPGLFHRYTSNQLGGIAIKAAVEGKINPDDIGHVVMGNALESHRDGIYGARGMALAAGLPDEIPALTVRRICGSGAQAIVSGAYTALLGDHAPNRPLVVVGGAESMQYPHVIYNLRGRKQGETTVKYGALDCRKLAPGTHAQDLLHMALFDPYAGMAMANTAENLGRLCQLDRKQSDQFAYESQVKAAKARDMGCFEEEIVPVEVPVDASFSNSMLCNDTHIRDNISLSALAKLPAIFEPPDGMITPGNASAVVDGAAAMVLCRAAEARNLGLKPLCRLAGWGIAGVDPKIMGIGPVPATEQALAMAGIDAKLIDTVELNEAFAPQALACIAEFEKMGISADKVNPLGGAIALGHPLGATGAILTLTAGYHLRRNNSRYALVTMCIGGGQGIALILENIN